MFSLMRTAHPESSTKVMGNVLKMEAMLATGHVTNRTPTIGV